MTNFCEEKECYEKQRAGDVCQEQWLKQALYKNIEYILYMKYLINVQYYTKIYYKYIEKSELSIPDSST